MAVLCPGRRNVGIGHRHDKRATGFFRTRPVAPGAEHHPPARGDLRRRSSGRHGDPDRRVAERPQHPGCDAPALPRAGRGSTPHDLPRDRHPARRHARPRRRGRGRRHPGGGRDHRHLRRHARGARDRTLVQPAPPRAAVRPGDRRAGARHRRRLHGATRRNGAGRIRRALARDQPHGGQPGVAGPDARVSRRAADRPQHPGRRGSRAAPGPRHPRGRHGSRRHGVVPAELRRQRVDASRRQRRRGAGCGTPDRPGARGRPPRIPRTARQRGQRGPRKAADRRIPARRVDPGAAAGRRAARGPAGAFLRGRADAGPAGGAGDRAPQPGHRLRARIVPSAHAPPGGGDAARGDLSRGSVGRAHAAQYGARAGQRDEEPVSGKHLA